MCQIIQIVIQNICLITEVTQYWIYIYTKYGYKVKDFKNIFNVLNIKYSYIVQFFILENNTF
jgi:hypothetical protein